MINDNSAQELDDREIELMLKYAPAYSAYNGKNIKDKFTQKAQMGRKNFSLKKLSIIIVIATMLFIISITTLAAAKIIDISWIYRIAFGEKSDYIDRYIEPLTIIDSEKTEQDTTVATIADVTLINKENDNKINSILEKENKNDYIGINIDVDENVLIEKTGSQDTEGYKNPATIECEYDGIVIKLLSAINDEDVLRIFASVTDTKGNRLNEFLDFESWGLAHGHGGGVDVIDYNSETKTATVLITSLGSDHHGADALTINNLLVKPKKPVEGIPENNINIVNILAEHIPSIIPQPDQFDSKNSLWKGGGSTQTDAGEDLYHNSNILQPDEMGINFDSVDAFSISNIGFIDGKLHIQIKIIYDRTVYNSYYFALNFINSKKEIVYSQDANASFVLKHNQTEDAALNDVKNENNDVNDIRIEYQEIMYDAIRSVEQLKDLSITIDYQLYPISNKVEGCWALPFVIPEKITANLNVNKEIVINGESIKIDAISVSPIGVTVHLPKNMQNDYRHGDSVYIEYLDGTYIYLESSSFIGYEGESVINFNGPIIEMEKIKDIVINGEVINYAS